MQFSFHRHQTGLIIGASSEIARAVGERLNEKHPGIELYSLARNKEKGIDFDSNKYFFNYLDEQGWDTFSALVDGKRFDFILNFVGALNGNEEEPEKNLQSLNFKNLINSYEVNIKPLLLAIQKLEKKLKRDETTLVASLSAKVGSITENELGGWYSYRMAKSGLNMFLKTLSREFYFKKPKCIVNAIHPGTTKTRFTQNYLSSVKHKIHEPEETAKNLIDVWESLGYENTGEFRNWDGEKLPW